MLNDIPEGAVCYRDATIFYYHIVGVPTLSDECSDLLKRIELGRVQGVTSSVALAEASHKVMARGGGASPRCGAPGIARLKRHPELLDSLTSHHRVVATVRSLRLPVEVITLDLLARGAALSIQERLLTNDALTLVVMKQLGVTVLATNDDDFDTISGITIYKPLRT